jgi:predicted enzyme related to lactoylglutathione lyase
VQQESEGIGGAIFQHREGMPPNAPSVGVMVDDLQAYLDKAVGLGGTALMQPMDIPGGFGSLAIFYDIAGNRIALFKSPEKHTHPQD